jgi:hypothetical protein
MISFAGSECLKCSSIILKKCSKLSLYLHFVMHMLGQADARFHHNYGGMLLESPILRERHSGEITGATETPP